MQCKKCGTPISTESAQQASTGLCAYCYAGEHPVKEIPVRGQILDKAKAIINGERQDSYGSPEASFALIGAYWSAYLKRRLTPVDVAHMMMLFKIARMSGQKPSEDNYADLCGYAGIAADMTKEMEQSAPPL